MSTNPYIPTNEGGYYIDADCFPVEFSSIPTLYLNRKQGVYITSLSKFGQVGIDIVGSSMIEFGQVKISLNKYD